ncbi:hypothetical protein chiPu_0030940 [Chiloscyllium punctatum]|uniref:Uncharacterized protein n=1 Tax=Chiloscyllium punctatum TaxID=137246 RepID=A0A401TVS1_CHIPU|nr:hypothetical protein [Chiloscyllium punctatum]
MLGPIFAQRPHSGRVPSWGVGNGGRGRTPCAPRREEEPQERVDVQRERGTPSGTREIRQELEDLFRRLRDPQAWRALGQLRRAVERGDWAWADQESRGLLQALQQGAGGARGRA